MISPNRAIEDLRSTKPPGEMTEAYHKARRLFGFFSAILIAWEYIGVRLGTQPPNLYPVYEALTGENGVTSELPIFKTPLTIQYPDVIPTVILILVLYFAARFTIEWHQCDPERQRHPASQVDRLLAYGLGLFAVALYGVQKITKFRLADILTPKAMAAMVPAAILASAAYQGTYFLLRWYPLKQDRYGDYYKRKTPLLIIVPMLACIAVVAFLMKMGNALFALSFLVGWTCSLGVIYVLQRYRREVLLHEELSFCEQQIDLATQALEDAQDPEKKDEAMSTLRYYRMQHKELSSLK